ncbi:pyridoxamine 5'-phosphate oxidase family protein [Hyphococcus luteus]|uniref:Pyridoxamine 5'-phosphate oxidase n=1 Tax=Hyphococcus luteus TaxID=2058213 RepID=A0A2S7K4R1_9PROT|nr:pyridoxamine 5'-phosphate oxidase family protein [Marinicaulis flavus]PQA87497.1 pyridoxamine 5'-phosphate oxidase [Marinicaulis flavus]
MDAALKQQIIDILKDHRTMTVATLRPDGWPQATTVGYAHDGLTLYFLCGKDSQKAANLAEDDRVSVTIDRDTDQVMDIKGLSMAAHATRIADPAEGRKAIKLLFSRYPEQKNIPFEAPSAEDVALFRLEPVVISVLDYSKGFAHTDLVTL